jgi:uncharacterized protein (UPF0248 family)
MPFPKDILNELKWRTQKDLTKAEIWYVHRGAPDDTMVVTGNDILDLEHSFMVISKSGISSHIPYHRIFKIVYENEVIFERNKRE